MQTKKSVFEAVSIQKRVARVKDEKYWLLIKDDRVMQQIKAINKGDEVEYQTHYDPKDKKLVLDSIAEIGAVGHPKPNSTPAQSSPTGVIMKECIKDIDSMMVLVRDESIRKSMNWSAIINTYFIERMRKR